MASVFTVQLPLLSSYTTGGSGLASNSLGGGKQQQQNPQPAGSSFKKFHPTLVNEKSIAYAINDIIVLFDYTQRSQQQQAAILSWSVKEVINCLSASGLPMNYYLGVGTNTCIYVFDIRSQAPLYYTPLDDGVFSLLSIQPTLFLAGCNCSIQGFDNNGESVYWNVVGDRVTAMCCLKAAQNVSSAQSSQMQTKLQISIKSTFSGGKSLGAANVKSAANEFSAMANTRVVVACEDKSIAVFEDEDLLWEMSESSPVTQLIAIDQNTFAFLTEGGMVGVYVKDQLKWRQPCPRPPTCLALFDAMGNGAKMLAMGMADGSWLLRSIADGVLIRTEGKHPNNMPVVSMQIVGFLVKPLLLIFYANGEIRGFQSGYANTVEDRSKDQANELLQLQRRKQTLVKKLEELNENLRLRADDAEQQKQLSQIPMIPENIYRATLKLDYVMSSDAFGVRVSVPEDLLIYTIFTKSDNITPNRQFVSLDKPANSFVYILNLDRDVKTTVFFNCAVSTSGSNQFVLMEKIELPAFTAYDFQVNELTERPSSHASFVTQKSPSHVVKWAQENILIMRSTTNKWATEQTMDLRLRSLRDRGQLVLIEMRPHSSNGFMLLIWSDNIETTAEFLQSLAVEYLHLVDGVELKCEFPRVMESLRKLIDTITSLHAVQTSLSTTVAEKLPLLKEYILMAEDARTLGNMQVMRDMYMVVNELNAEMIGEHAKRSKQHQELVSSLKTLNTFIQRSSVLRVSQRERADIVQSCREAIKNNQLTRLLETIRLQ